MSEERKVASIDVIHDSQDHRRLNQLLISDELWNIFRGVIVDGFDKRNVDVEFNIIEGVVKL